MLDIKFVRENQDAVREAMENRNASWDAARFSELDESRREAIQQEEALQAERNTLSKEIGKEPVEVAEGRVWFVFDGQRLDITGQFDEEHAFVYETTNPETGLPNYILVGWSAGGIGYGEIVFLPGETDDDIHSFSAHTLGVVWMDADYPIFDHTYAPDPDANDWFRNAVEEICAPYLEKSRPAEGTYETEPPRIEPGPSALPEPGLN